MKLFDQIKYLNYVYFSAKSNITHIPQRSILITLFKTIGKSFLFLGYFIKDLLLFQNSLSSKNKLVFFVMSENNYLSLNPVYNKFPQNIATVIVGDKRFNKDVLLFTPIVIATLTAIFFFPKLLYDYCLSNKGDRIRFKKGIHDVILSYPFYYICYFWFKIVKPKGIVISNDHVYSTRTLVYWANRFKIPSFYIQHASISEEFPPLEVTYALLDGEDAKEKYLLVGSDPTKIELIGVPKLDAIFGQINYSKNIHNIGIASNSLESLQLIFDTIISLDNSYPDIKLIYRPHKAQYYDTKRKNDLKSMIKNLPSRVEISNPFEEIVTDYLSKIDCLVAGDSGIHVEAVFLNITSIYFFSNQAYYDYYGFVKNNLIIHAKDFTELKNIIDKEKSNRHIVRYKAKKYCYTVDSPYDGHSTNLAVNRIINKLSN